jgi:hypothetical protein
MSEAKILESWAYMGRQMALYAKGRSAPRVTSVAKIVPWGGDERFYIYRLPETVITVRLAAHMVKARGI